MHNPVKFRIFYNQTIFPELMRLDKQRRRMLRRIFLSLLLMLGLAALLLYIQIMVIALVAVIPFIIYIYYQFGQIKKFKQEFKPRVVELILDFIDDGLLFGDLKYDAKKKVSIEKFIRSNIFGARPAIYDGEDYIEGRIGDVEFEMSELHVEEFSRVRSRLDLVFKGIFVRAKFFHPLKGSLLVLPKDRLPFISNALKTYIRHNGQPMDAFVRHRKFTKPYTVYGTANTKVGELLPNHLMDFILEARKKTGEIYLSIFKDNCYIAISNEKDILEPKIFQSNVSFELVREFYDDIYTALYIGEELDKAH
ncbi:MAG TPA: DUF3137 domain-containing protein [Bacteroidetes bacterium]|nr:DUF3137 domain-containing protein [Bacteroidota bacterium]